MYPTIRLEVHRSIVKEILVVEFLNNPCRHCFSSINTFKQSLCTIFLQIILNLGFRLETNLLKPSDSTSEKGNSCNTIILMSSLHQIRSISRRPELSRRKYVNYFVGLRKPTKLPYFHRPEKGRRNKQLIFVGLT
jgi:hypothetical protein